MNFRSKGPRILTENNHRENVKVGITRDKEMKISSILVDILSFNAFNNETRLLYSDMANLVRREAVKFVEIT